MSNELDLREYLLIIRKRLPLIIAFVLLCTIVTAVFSIFFVDRVYQASTKIIVNQTAAQMTTGQIDINQINSNIKMIDTYKEIIKTPAIMDKVVEQYPQLGLTSAELARKVKVNSVNNTQVMTLVVEDLSYSQAADIVNAVSTVFQQEISKIFKVENVSILNLAVKNDQPTPVSPNIKMNIAISIIVSLMLAVGVVFLIEYLDDTVKTEADVQQYLGLPTLGQISRVSEQEMGGVRLNSKKANQDFKVGDMNHVSIDK